ncbi:FHA domain-containing protein [Povalibacter sp.]|uniref:FHA domain-containing protein n=1 Tax=Povalibacter sp. TaxID=1962978 RepID=UPI002F42E543
MEVLLRELREGPDGIPEYHDTQISAAVVTIGSAADQRLQLLGKSIAAHHASIRQSGSQLELTCRAGKVRVNGELQGSAKLVIGDVIEIGSHQLQLVQPPVGFDAALELRPDKNIDASAFEGAFRTDLLQTWMGKRPTAWMAIGLILIVGLALPLAAVMMHRADRAVPAMMPGDALWSSGPLSAAHRQAIGDRCNVCHQTLFQRVTNESCGSCHQSIHDHVRPEHLALTQLDRTQRCATCHREHNEPETYLVNSGDGECLACHQNSNHTFGSLDVAPVEGFGGAGHPEFKARLLKPHAPDANASTMLQWLAERASIDAAVEQSNLKFSHAQHLDTDRVRRGGDGEQLDCADCHRLQSNGEHFEPITMEANCSSCHELTFDPSAPDRQLPHGKPRDVVLTLQDYFTRKIIDPDAARATWDQRRLPASADSLQPCNASAFACAMRSALAETENQFTRHGCIGCHTVVDTQSKVLADRFQVVPIRLARDYFPAARFDHRSHESQGKLTGGAACLSCHKAADSRESSDLLLPPVATCESCHSDRPLAERVTTSCVTCHAFHPQGSKPNQDAN